jgi:hydrogenase maturation protein HypF
VLVADRARARRVARLRPVALPGGDAAAREPWRMALAHLVAAGVDDERVEAARVDAPASARTLVRAMIARGVNAPATTSAGRLFDAVAALSGVRARATREGQAAAELEAVSHAFTTFTTGPECAEPYALPLGCAGGLLELDPRPLVRAFAEDACRGVATGEIGARFHAALAAGIGLACRAVRGRTALAAVVLTGGCFQNRLLTELAAHELERSGFEVLLHERVPPGDGGLALGQAAVAAERLHDVSGDPR